MQKNEEASMINESILKAAQEQADAIQLTLNSTIGEAYSKMHDMRQARQDELANILGIVDKYTGEKPTEAIIVAAIEAAYCVPPLMATPIEHLIP